MNQLNWERSFKGEPGYTLAGSWEEVITEGMMPGFPDPEDQGIDPSSCSCLLTLWPWMKKKITKITAHYHTPDLMLLLHMQYEFTLFLHKHFKVAWLHNIVSSWLSHLGLFDSKAYDFSTMPHCLPKFLAFLISVSLLKWTQLDHLKGVLLRSARNNLGCLWSAVGCGLQQGLNTPPVYPSFSSPAPLCPQPWLVSFQDIYQPLCLWGASVSWDKGPVPVQESGSPASFSLLKPQSAPSD